MTTTLSPNNTAEAMAFLRLQHASGSTAWERKCLVLARTARGIDMLNPTALSAAHATPEADRVYDLADCRKGMVLYFDDPNDGNPAGHIASDAGRNADDIVLTWSNDAKRVGGVDLVRADFFPANWGDAFLFGAKSLNGVKLDLAADKPKPKPKPEIGAKAPNFDAIEKAFAQAIKVHDDRGHKALVRELKVELGDIERIRKEHSK